MILPYHYHYNEIMIKDDLLSSHIGMLLRDHGLMLASAESCSGGLLGHMLTEIAGASDYFLGGVVAYSNLAKFAWLSVQQATINQYGAVSRETVLEMALGVRKALRGHYPEEDIIGISISGVAGPGGGTATKPVGTVWIGLSAYQSNFSWLHHFEGNRSEIKQHSALHALKHLREFLLQLNTDT